MKSLRKTLFKILPNKLKIISTNKWMRKLKSQREELEEEISSYQRQADFLFKQDKNDIEQLKKLSTLLKLVYSSIVQGHNSLNALE